MKRATAARWRDRVAWVVVAAIASVAAAASAQDSATDDAAESGARTQTGEGYEESRLRAALAETQLTIEPSPQGKRIAFIRLVRHDVFIAEEPWPEWPNMFHTLTREAVIAREYLFAVGDTYNQALVEETERNLRALNIFAIARVVAVKAEAPGSVGVLVHTRDLWSLRSEWDLQASGLNFGRFFTTGIYGPIPHERFTTRGTVVDRLLLQGTERNLFGLNKTLAVRLQMDPIVFSIGEVYIDRRILLGDHRVDQLFDVFFNRSTLDIEGSQGRLLLYKPFYNLAQRISYKLDAQYIARIGRVVRTGAVSTYDIPETDEVETIRRVWDDRSGFILPSASLRFGEQIKHMLTVGLGYRDRSVQPNEQTGLTPEQRAAFRRDVLPRVRRELFPSLTIEVFEARFTTFNDLGTFGQIENVRLGFSGSIGATLPIEAWGSSTDSATLALNAGYVIAPSGGLFEATAGAYGRYEEGELINQQLSLQVRGATPFMFGSRLVFRTLWDGRRRDTENTTVTLGGDNGLRGYPSQALIGFGASRILSSFELRTRPITWSSVQVGFVLFYDAGTVYESLRRAQMHYAVGGGARILFPQFSRYTMCIDFGVPLDQAGFSVIASFGGNQAIPLTAAEDEIIAATY